MTGDDVPTRQLAAVRWIVEGANMTPPVKRTQLAAAAKFGIPQPVISLGMKKYLKDRGLASPDGRKGWPRPGVERNLLIWMKKDEI